MYTIITIVLVIVTIFLYIRWFFKKSHQFFNRYGIPHSKPHWFFGNMKNVILMKKSIGIGFKEIYEKFSNERFAGVYNMHTPIVTIRDPELLKMILVKDFSHFRDRDGLDVSKEIERAYNMRNLSTDEWKNLRIKLLGTFTSGKMKMMFPLIKKCAEDIKPVLIDDCSNVDGIDIKDFCARFTIDVIGSCAFGIDAQSLRGVESDFRKMGRQIFGFRWRAALRTFLPKLPSSLIKITGLDFFPKQATDYFLKTVEEMVKYKEENNIYRGDFLDILIAMKNQQNQNNHPDSIGPAAQTREKYSNYDFDVEITIPTIAVQCFLFFMAGFEGASNTLSFLLVELATHPEIQSRIRTEILSALEKNAGQFSYEMMKEMPYLEMAVAEIFRKYPLCAILSRKCTENFKIPETEVVITKDTSVVVPVMGLHNDPKYYEKPDDFYPEHFTKEAKLGRPNLVYLPFGEGPRMCIAERFGRMQVTIGAVYLLKDFIWELSPKTTLPLPILPTGAGMLIKDTIWMKCRPLK